MTDVYCWLKRWKSKTKKTAATVHKSVDKEPVRETPDVTIEEQLPKSGK